MKRICLSAITVLCLGLPILGSVATIGCNKTESGPTGIQGEVKQEDSEEWKKSEAESLKTNAQPRR